MQPPKPTIDRAALTIAGSDSCGGAGIQADLKTFHDFNIYGASVITALTAQNTRAVTLAEGVSPQMIAAQLEAVLDDLPITAIKTGMLPDAAAVEILGEILARRCAGVPLVVDPVLVATSGASLTLEDTIQALRDHLIPLATLVTPNLAEAEALTGEPPDGDPRRTADPLLALGCRAVLVKGGHGERATMTDWLVSDSALTPLEHPGAAGEYHGTGCVLSSAIAAALAGGRELEQAVADGVAHVQSAIAGARLPLAGDLHLIT